jgi:hypothetical protein
MGETLAACVRRLPRAIDLSGSGLSDSLPIGVLGHGSGAPTAGAAGSSQAVPLVSTPAGRELGVVAYRVRDQELPSSSVNRPDWNRQPRCAFRSDDRRSLARFGRTPPTRTRRLFDASVDPTEARKPTVRGFGRSHQSAQRSGRGVVFPPAQTDRTGLRRVAVRSLGYAEAVLGDGDLDKTRRRVHRGYPPDPDRSLCPLADSVSGTKRLSRLRCRRRDRWGSKTAPRSAHEASVAGDPQVELRFPHRSRTESTRKARW